MNAKYPFLNAMAPTTRVQVARREADHVYRPCRPGDLAAGHVRVLRERREGDGRHRRDQAFYRFFPAPGMAHCGGGAGPNTFDALAALDAWVETGTAPDRFLRHTQPTGGSIARVRYARIRRPPATVGRRASMTPRTSPAAPASRRSRAPAGRAPHRSHHRRMLAAGRGGKCSTRHRPPARAAAHPEVALAKSGMGELGCRSCVLPRLDGNENDITADAD